MAPALQAQFTTPRPQVTIETTAVQQFSFVLLIAFLFMIFSRIFDVAFSWLHIPGISYRLMGLFLVISGAFIPALRDNIGRYVFAFTGFFIAAIPFSVWRTGSLFIFTDYWLVGLVVFVATAALIPDFRQYSRTVRTITLAILLLAVISITLGTMRNGRLFLEHGRFSNPNEMAQALLLGLPFWWALYANARSLFAKLFAAASIGFMLFVISRTGSRGALVSIVVIIVFMFARASFIGKVKLVAAGGVLLALAAVTLPQNLKARYQTIFSSDPEADEADDDADRALIGSALASSSSREFMLERSLYITGHHPFLGVGPGMFVVEEDSLAKAEGKRRGAWLGTHNTFTQVSSECGIPALIFYCGIVVLSFKRSYALYRRTRANPALQAIGNNALALNYSLLAFVVTGMFVHAAYTSLLPVLAGLTVSLARTAEPLVAEAEAGMRGAAKFSQAKTAFPLHGSVPLVRTAGASAASAT